VLQDCFSHLSLSHYAFPLMSPTGVHVHVSKDMHMHPLFPGCKTVQHSWHPQSLGTLKVLAPSTCAHPQRVLFIKSAFDQVLLIPTLLIKCTFDSSAPQI